MDKVLLLDQRHGEKLVELCQQTTVTAEFTVKADPYPRRSLPKKLCQATRPYALGLLGYERHVPSSVRALG